MDAVETIRSYDKSAKLTKDAACVLCGGMGLAQGSWYDAPNLRSGSVGSSFPDIQPVFTKAKGAALFDVDGNEYVDYLGANGSLILGHADDRVVAAIDKTAAKGCSFGAPSDLAVRLCELVVSRIESIDLVVPTHSPAQALLGCASLARSHTGREVVCCFDGFWHGPVVGAHDPRTTDKSASLYDIKYNDSNAIGGFFEQHATELAAVVVEPGAVSRGVSTPAEGFLQTLRNLCDQNGTLLIYDETLTGFRLAPGGAAEFFGVAPDLTVLGPLIGGGISFAAYGGPKDLMASAPLQDPMVQPNPLSGSLLAVAAGIATLEAIGEPGFHAELDGKATSLADGLVAAVSTAGAPLNVRRIANIVGLSRPSAADLDDAGYADWFGRFYGSMLEQGIFLPATPEPCLFVSAAHGDDEINRTLAAAKVALATGLST